MVRVEFALVSTLAVAVLARGRHGGSPGGGGRGGYGGAVYGGGGRGGGYGGGGYGAGGYGADSYTRSPYSDYPDYPDPSSTYCPTVTETATICSLCPMRECFAMSTISSLCGCPAAAATVTESYPCGADGQIDECPMGCATTSYAYETAAPSCEASETGDDPAEETGTTTETPFPSAPGAEPSLSSRSPSSSLS